MRVGATICVCAGQQGREQAADSGVCSRSRSKWAAPTRQPSAGAGMRWCAAAGRSGPACATAAGRGHPAAARAARGRQQSLPPLWALRRLCSRRQARLLLPACPPPAAAPPPPALERPAARTSAQSRWAKSRCAAAAQCRARAPRQPSCSGGERGRGGVPQSCSMPGAGQPTTAALLSLCLAAWLAPAPPPCTHLCRSCAGRGACTKGKSNPGSRPSCAPARPPSTAPLASS